MHLHKIIFENMNFTNIFVLFKNFRNRLHTRNIEFFVKYQVKNYLPLFLLRMDEFQFMKKK